MPELKAIQGRRYGAYASQRLYRILLDLKNEQRNLTFSSMADAIYLWRGVKFQRMNFYRLRDGKLQDGNTEIIVSWLEATHEPDIRARLHPHAIFDEVGKSSRDYYFNIPADNVVEDWDPQIMQAFSGIYLCAKANDRNSYLPLPTLRRWFENPEAMPAFKKKDRSVSIAQYVGERSILILQAKKEAGYFYAAEFPLSALYPNSVQAMDVRMVYEGIGIASANSIHIQLRECLARVPKTHSILIGQKSSYHSANKQGFSMYLHPGMEAVKAEWDHLSQSEQAAMQAEYVSAMQAEHYLTGPAQISVSPLSARKNRVGLNFSEEMIYYRKPPDFLRDKNTHFLLPILDNTQEIEKLLANPLTIGDIL